LRKMRSWPFDKLRVNSGKKGLAEPSGVAAGLDGIGVASGRARAGAAPAAGGARSHVWRVAYLQEIMVAGAEACGIGGDGGGGQQLG